MYATNDVTTHLLVVVAYSHHRCVIDQSRLALPFRSNCFFLSLVVRGFRLIGIAVPANTGEYNAPQWKINQLIRIKLFGIDS